MCRSLCKVIAIEYEQDNNGAIIPLKSSNELYCSRLNISNYFATKRTTSSALQIDCPMAKSYRSNIRASGKPLSTKQRTHNVVRSDHAPKVTLFLN